MRVTIIVPLLFSVVLLSFGPAIAQEASENTGSIEAKLSSPYARRSEGVIYITNAQGEFTPPEENPIMDQRKLIFIPHVLPVLIGTTVDFPNNDVVRHNVFSPKSSVQQFNLGTYAAGVTKQRIFDEVGDIKLLCNVHPEMAAFIIVCPSPYFAVTDKKTGSGTVENLPPGTYEVTFWHERLRGKTATVTVEAGETATVTFSRLSRKR